MRALIQRVRSSTLYIEGKVYSSISEGILVLLGVEADDNFADIEWLASKIVKLRIFDDSQGIMNLSVTESKGEIMVVSQFTLHASTRKGNRPSYVRAARPDVAKLLYEKFITRIEAESGCNVSEGVFGAHMEIQLVNNGPVTIIIDSKIKE